MSDERRSVHDPLLEWRVDALEKVELAMRAELHELRAQMARREDCYSKPEIRELFVSRTELERKAAVRREWPLIICAAAVVAIGVINLIVTVGGH